MLQCQRTELAMGPVSALPPGSFSEALKSTIKAPFQLEGQAGGAEPAQAACARQDPPQYWRSPLQGAGQDMVAGGDPPLDTKAALGPRGDCTPDPHHPRGVFPVSWSHGELPSPQKQPGQVSDSRASTSTRTSSQGTRHSDTCHVSRLKGGASTAASPAGRERQGQLPGSLLPGLGGQLDTDPGPRLPMPGPLPLHEAFPPQISAQPGFNPGPAAILKRTQRHMLRMSSCCAWHLS